MRNPRPLREDERTHIILVSYDSKKVKFPLSLANLSKVIRSESENSATIQIPDATHNTLLNLQKFVRLYGMLEPDEKRSITKEVHEDVQEFLLGFRLEELNNLCTLAESLEITKLQAIICRRWAEIIREKSLSEIKRMF